MTLLTRPFDETLAEVAAALHGEANLPERWSADSFRQLIGMPGISGLLAVVDETPAGLVLWRLAADEAEILTICVTPEQRRHGIGRALMMAARHDVVSRGAASLHLEVSVSNLAAIALYAAMGFVRSGLRRGYYVVDGERVDAIAMTLAL